MVSLIVCTGSVPYNSVMFLVISHLVNQTAFCENETWLLGVSSAGKEDLVCSASN